MFLKSLLLICFLSLSLLSDNRSFNQIVYDNKIDIESKSIKSWIRTFNSKEKILKHGFILNEAERYIMLKGLKNKQTKSKRRYSRRVR